MDHRAQQWLIATPSVGYGPITSVQSCEGAGTVVQDGTLALNFDRRFLRPRRGSRRDARGSDPRGANPLHGTRIARIGHGDADHAGNRRRRRRAA
jgi:hypothetical protein